MALLTCFNGETTFKSRDFGVFLFLRQFSGTTATSLWSQSHMKPTSWDQADSNGSSPKPLRIRSFDNCGSIWPKIFSRFWSALWQQDRFKYDLGVVCRLGAPDYGKSTQKSPKNCRLVRKIINTWVFFSQYLKIPEGKSFLSATCWPVWRHHRSQATFGNEKTQKGSSIQAPVLIQRMLL